MPSIPITIDVDQVRSALEALGTSVGNVASTAWNGVSSVPQRIQESRRRDQLLDMGFSRTFVKRQLNDERAIREAVKIGKSSGGVDLSKFLKGERENVLAKEKEKITSIKDQKAHHKVIQELHRQGLYTIANIVDRRLRERIEQGRRGSLDKSALEEETQKKAKQVRLVSSLITTVLVGHLTNQAIGAYFAKDRNPLADQYIRNRNKSVLQSGLQGGAIGAVAGGKYFGGWGALAGLLIGGSASAFLTYFTEKEKRKTEAARAKFERYDPFYSTRFERSQQLARYAFNQQMNMTGFSGQIKLIRERIHELRIGDTEKPGGIAQIRNAIRNGRAQRDTSLAGLEAALSFMSKGGPEEAKFDSEYYKRTLALRNQRLQEISNLRIQETELMAKPNLSYLNASSVTDAFSAKGLGVGAQVDVVSVNRNILSELRKCVMSLREIATRNNTTHGGSFISNAAATALWAN